MCRVDERVYVRADGHRSVFQDPFMCERGKRHGRVCRDAEVRRTEYPDPTSSPIASSPLTPNGPRTRRLSTSSRPSTRDGPITSLTPEIHIQIASKKGKSNITLTTGKTKRASGGSSSAYDSPSSEASHTVRTGYPDISPPPLSRGGLRPNSGQYRNPSSDESISGSSRVTQPYHTSDGYDTPSLATGTTATSTGTRPIIHNPSHVPPINSTRGNAGSSPSTYRTAEVKPSGLYAGDSDYSRSSSTYAPEKPGRDQDRQERREQRKRQQQQEAIDAEVATGLIREGNTKQVRFETGRANPIAEERAYATSDSRKSRQPDDRREPLRQEARAREIAAKEAAAREAAAREAALKRSKSSGTASKPTRTRKSSVSMTSAQAAEQAQLLAAEKEQIQRERIRTEALEREEWAAQQVGFSHGYPQGHQPTLQERQKDSEYYNPRGNGSNRAPQPSATNPQPPIIRRPSQVNQPRPTTLRKPSFGTQETAPPLQRQPRGPPGPPPLSSYWNTSAAQAQGLPSTRSERRPSSSHGSSPFVQPASAIDPWDSRNMRDALPSARGAQVGYNLPPQQATQRMQQAVSQNAYSDPFISDSEDETHKYNPRKR